MISTVRVAVLFTFRQRHLIRGFTAGALPGEPAPRRTHRPAGRERGYACDT
jgi:hypothetical protein